MIVRSARPTSGRPGRHAVPATGKRPYAGDGGLWPQFRTGPYRGIEVVLRQRVLRVMPAAVMQAPNSMQPRRPGPAPLKYGSSTSTPGPWSGSPKKTPTGVRAEAVADTHLLRDRAHRLVGRGDRGVGG